jgi:hypothetical protein
MGGNAQGLPKRTAALLGPDSDTSGSGHDANPSVRFGNAVAASAEEFGERFGHYGRQVSRAFVLWARCLHYEDSNQISIMNHVHRWNYTRAEHWVLQQLSSRSFRVLLQAAAPELGCWTFAIWARHRHYQRRRAQAW